MQNNIVRDSLDALEQEKDEEDISSDALSSNEVDINIVSNSLDALEQEDKSVEVDNDTTTSSSAVTAVKEDVPFQDTLYNHYSKTYPELFKGGKLDDIEGAKEKGIISEYNYVPTDDSAPIAAHSSTITQSEDGFPPVAYRYNKKDEFELGNKESLREQTESSFRVVNLFKEEDAELQSPELLPDAFGTYKDVDNKIVELPFMDGKLMEGYNTNGLTEVTNEDGKHVVEDSLMKQMATVPIIGPALYSGMFEVLDSIDYVPAAFKDIVETAGEVLYANETVWDAMNVSLKATSNRSFANPKDMAEQLADGSGSFLEYLGTSGIASKVAGMGDDITRATGFYRQGLGKSKKEINQNLKLFKNYKQAVKQVDKKEKDAKWLANRIEKAINIERIKYATDVELKEKVDAAKKVADENKSIRTEFIDNFEETVKKTVSKTDESGNKVLDYEGARKVGLELLEENADPSIAQKIGPRIDVISHPILKPEKLDGLVAVTKEFQKKYPSAFNNKNTIIDNLFDLTVAKDLKIGENLAGSPGDELLTTLNKYGLSFEEYILTVVGSGSQAAKVMNKLSQIKRARPLTETELLAQKAAQAADSSIMNYAMRIENIRRGGLVSQIATAARNVFSGSIRAPMESLANIADTAMYNMSREGYGAGVKTLLKPQNYKDAFANWKYIYDDPKASKELTDFLLDRPELIKQYDLMLNNLNEIQKVQGRGTGSVTDKIISKGEDVVSFLNLPNRWQEYLIRRGSYLGELQRLVRNEYKIDLLETLNAGKIKDLLNDSSTVVPKGARSFNEISADAVQRALDVTYAKQPDLKPFKVLSSLLTRSIIGTVIMPFPRFMFNSMELMGQYMAGGSIPLTKKAIKILSFGTVFKGSKQMGIYSFKDRQRISRNLVGLAAIGGFYSGYKALSETGESPTDYKQLPVGDGTTLDLSPLYPLRPYAYIGKALEKVGDGTFEDWYDAKEFAETFLGTNVRTGVVSGLLDDMVDAVSGGADLSTFARGAKIGGKLLSNYLQTWAVPFAQLLEAQRITGERGTTYKDLSPEPSLDPYTNFTNEIKRPFNTRGFTDPSGKTEADAPKREFIFQEEKKRVAPAYRVLFGLNLTTQDSDDGEYLKDIGYTEFNLSSKSESPKVRRFENAILREFLPTIVDITQSMEKMYEKEYKRQKVGFKETISKDKYMINRLKPIIDGQFRLIKQKIKDGKIGAGGPYVKAMIDYKRLTKTNRKWATVEFLKMYDRPAEASNTKDLRTLVKIGEKYGKILNKALGSRK